MKRSQERRILSKAQKKKTELSLAKSAADTKFIINRWRLVGNAQYGCQVVRFEF